MVGWVLGFEKLCSITLSFILDGIKSRIKTHTTKQSFACLPGGLVHPANNKAPKTRSYSGLHNCIVHAWEVHSSTEELFWIVYMDRPRVGSVRLVVWCTHWLTPRAIKMRSYSGLHTWIVHAWKVDWCTCWPTRRALKTRSFSRLHLWKVQVWEVFDWWTGAVVDQLVEPKN